MDTQHLLRVTRRESAASQVHQILRQALLGARFRPGERLIETELADRLGVSRTPVREALSKLEVEGLVEPSPSGGVIVRDLEAELVEIYGLRQRLEGYAASLAAQRISSAELAALEAAAATALTSLENPRLEERAELNNRFHRLLTAGSHSPRLVRLVNDYRDYFLSHQTLLFYDREAALRQHQQHHEIVEAIRRRDSERAERLVRQHFQTALEIIQVGIEREQARQPAPARDDTAPPSTTSG